MLRSSRRSGTNSGFCMPTRLRDGRGRESIADSVNSLSSSLCVSEFAGRGAEKRKAGVTVFLCRLSIPDRAQVAAGGLLRLFEEREMFVGRSQEAWRPMRNHILRLDMRVVAGVMHDLGVSELFIVMESLSPYATATGALGGAIGVSKTRQPRQTPIPFRSNSKTDMSQRD